MKLKITILLSAFLIISNLTAQQFPVYTQYVFNEYLMNPAVAGTVDHIPIRLSYRNQWAGFTDMKGDNIAPKTFAFSAHAPITDHLGLGGFAYSDVTGPISHSVAQLSYSWRTCLSRPSCFWEKKKFISLAYGTRFMQFSYDDTQTTSWNEYFGLADDPVLPDVIETDFLMSHSVAAYFYTEYLYTGFAAQNLFARPLRITSDLLYDNRLTPEFNFIAGAYLPISEDKSFAIEPSILTKSTSWSQTQIDFSMRVLYENNVWIGGTYRASEAAYAVLFGVEAGDLHIGFAYDTAVEGISNYSSGTYELSIGFNLDMFANLTNVRLKSRFKNRRMLLNPFRQNNSRSDRRGSGS